MNLKSMSIDKLSKLKEQVAAAINAKVIEERRTVQDQLSKLDRLAANGSRGKVGRGGMRGAVATKYRNPENPSETCAGRGLRPRWLAAAEDRQKAWRFQYHGARKGGPASNTKERAPEIGSGWRCRLRAAGRGPSHGTAQETLSPHPCSGHDTGCHRRESSPRRCAHIANQVFATRVAHPTHG
jgi:DNA-binding protein H-NS